MSEAPPFQLRHLGGPNFVLTKTHPPGTSQDIGMTANEVLELARRLPQFAQQVLEFQNPSVAAAGLPMRVPAAIRGYETGHDLQQRFVVLSIDDEFGLTTRFSLPSDDALRLAHALITEVDKMSNVPLTRQ
jgi:hypothetical protein